MDELRRRAEEIRDEKLRNHNTAERVGGFLVDMTDCFGEILKDSEELMNEVFPISFHSFSGGGTFEKGQKVSPVISWVLERKDEEVLPTSATVNGVTDGVAPDFKSFTGEPIDYDKSYRICVTSGMQSVEKSASYAFKYKKFWGTSDKITLTNADIEGMNSAFATSKLMGKTMFDCSGGKYPYYILPSDMADEIEVWINGFRNTDIDVSDLEVTNDYNVSKNYKVVRLNTIQTGVLTIEYK